MLAFRLFGYYVWPPVYVHPSQPPAQMRVAGVVEIHFLPNQTGTGALLRWVPGRLVPARLDPVALTPQVPNVFEGNAPEQHFSPDAEQVVWIHAPAANFGRRLAFRGAFWLEQFVAGETEDTLDLALPLVRTCQYRSDEPHYFSSLIVGQDGSDNFRFDLQLPVPVAQTSLPQAGELNPAVLPFSVLYRSRTGAVDPTDPVQAASLTQVLALVPGASGRGHKTFQQDRHFEVPAAERRLGGFGFSAGGGDAAGFAAYAGNLIRPGLPIDVRNFWPDAGGIEDALDQSLRRFGFEVAPRPFRALTLASDNERQLSLRFPRPPEGARGPDGTTRRAGRLIYRLTFRVVGAAGPVGGDLAANGSNLAIRLAGELDGWLRIAAGDVQVELELSWSVGRDDIWASEPTSDWSPRIALRLLWNEALPASFGHEAAAGLDGRVCQAGTLVDAADAASALHEALRWAEGGQPQSLMPVLSPAQGSQVARFMLFSPTGAATFETDGRLRLRHGRADPVRPAMRLSLAPPDRLMAGETSERIKALATFPAFFQRSATAPAAPLQLPLLLGPSAVQDDPDLLAPAAFASFSLAWDATVAPARPMSWRGRLSSLEFSSLGIAWSTAVAATSGQGQDGSFMIGGAGVRTSGRSLGARLVDRSTVAVSATFSLAVSAIAPVGVDVPREDRTGRAGALLIPLDGAVAPPPAAAFVLQVSEGMAATQDRLLTATVFDRSKDAGSPDYVLLGREPFSVLRFSEVRLGGRGDAGNAAVATYSSDDRTWQFKQVSPFYHYALPPQAVGEGTDKPRRLELFDLDVPEAAGEGPFRPFDDAPPGGAAPTDGDRLWWGDLHRRAVAFRLTPSAEAWLRPSDVERGYFMPAWNSYDLFRQRGEKGLGASLAALRAEFLYGLPVGVDVAREDGVAGQARLAEIEALTGRPVGAAAPANAGDPLALRWNELTDAVARRPERLEIWASDPKSALDFAPARFAGGVSFALRRTALHRAPLAGQNGEFEAPDDLAHIPKAGRLRYHPQGLEGGALWPVESANLFRALRDSPDSGGGTLQAVALSPVGGDAQQKATFLNGKVTILSETRNGFVERQKVEVIGRIGALWHRAKHVVVYQRTVNPTAQFAPQQGDDPNNRRSRRPILRKVREYIELLQWERSYPDFDVASARSAAFLKRVRFNSRIINVDSAWSREVGRNGWEIPLWDRNSARERPQVYPLPDVAFVSLSEGEGDDAAVAQECAVPEKLFFFADFSTETSSDTDTWPAILGVDFANLPPASALASIVDARSSQDPARPARRRNVGRLLPGASRFSWRLAPAARKAAINGGRSAKPLYVSLDAVSFMRGTQVVSEVPKPLALIVAQRDAQIPADEINKLSYWSPGGRQVPAPVAPHARAFTAALGAFQGAARNRDTAALATAKTDIERAVLALKEPITGMLRAAAGQAARAADAVGKAKDLIGAGRQSCEALKSEAVATIRGKSALVLENVRAWEGEAGGLLAKPLRSKKELRDGLLASIRELIVPVFEETSRDVGRAGAGVETARAIVADTEAEAEAVLARARARVTDFSAAYDRLAPWSPTRRDAFQAGLVGTLSSVPDDLEAATDEARQRLAVELGDLTQAVGGHLAVALGAIAKDEAAALGALKTVGGAVGRLLKPMEDLVAGLLDRGGLDQAGGAVADARKAVEANVGIGQPLKTAVLDALQRAADSLDAVRTKLLDARALSVKIEAATSDTAEAVAADCRAFAATLKDVVDELKSRVADLAAEADALGAAGLADVEALVLAFGVAVTGPVNEAAAWLDRKLADLGDVADAVVSGALEALDALLIAIHAGVTEAVGLIQVLAEDVGGALRGMQAALAPRALLDEVFLPEVIGPALDGVLAPYPEALQDLDETRAGIAKALLLLGDKVAAGIDALTADALDAVGGLSSFCGIVGEDAQGVIDYFEGLRVDTQAFVEEKVASFLKRFDDQYGAFVADVATNAESAANLIATAEALDYCVRGLNNDLARSAQTARMFGDRVMDAVGKIDLGKPLSVPSTVLKAYAAVTSAPEIAALKADIDRIRAGFDEASDLIRTTRATALFNHLGDELKALGISFPFEGIGDRIVPADLSSFDFSAVFRHLGGVNLDRLLQGYKLPAGAADAIRVTHDFDKARQLAWVQVDIDLPMPGRRTLFSLEVFQADFVDMRVTGRVRLEASKDSDTVSQTGFGRIQADLEMVVGGQPMVMFQAFGLNFTRESGLKVDFDPSRIRLHPSFQFIQDVLSGLFPDELGGLKVLKRDGVPIGVELDFALPPVSLMFGTSGVSNISISNGFRLVAFPDFVLADRFSLSRPELPFIFSIFIIGGTGYVQIEAEYQPFRNELTVGVEAAAGGSATLGLSLGPFSGSVFIALSIAISYHKLIGRPGGGLTVGMMLVIAGNVTVCGLVTVSIYLLLRMSYRDSGEVDADGTLSVSISISRFFKITARAEVRYKLRGGRSETVTSTSTATQADPRLQAAAKALKQARG